jgi:NAD(P)-dependent dehydrogenase (short-subunit alcohol dehydrogenase family)
MQIEDKVAIVTGAGSGIGRAMAAALADAGAKVVVGDIDGDSADATARLIADRGGMVVARRADAGAEADISALISDGDAQFGPVDIYVANAGITGPPGLVVPEREWDRVLDVNLRAHIRAATMLVPDWVDRGGGYFVATASAAGLLTSLGGATYAVSKHAAVAFAEWLAITYGDFGIGVSCVCPMGVNTPLLNEMRESPEPAARLSAKSVTEAGEMLEPERVAELTIEAMREGKFLVLPHPEVLDMYRQKGADYDRWIAGMRRYQHSLDDSGV